LRERYDEIKAAGAEVVAVGTGDVRYAAAFVDDENVPFPVLVDDDGQAARAAAVRRVGPFALVGPRSWPGSRRAWRAGYRVHRPGKRTNQLGATFVIGPGRKLHYSHLDDHTADHAPVGEVLAALPASST
jgi:peroxiredoxin